MFSSWECQYANSLNKISENISLNDKISLMYSPVLKIEKGEKTLMKMEKKCQQLDETIHSMLKKISLEFVVPQINIKTTQNRKQRLETSPKLEDHHEDSSIFLNVFLEESENMRTPVKNETRLARCKSNMQLKVPKD